MPRQKILSNISTLCSATYSQTRSCQPRHQVISNRTTNAAESQGSQWGNLAVLRLGRLRCETLTAEEATKNPRPRGQARVGISAGTLRNPARQCQVTLLHWISLGGFPSRDLQLRTTRPAQRGNKFASKGQIWPELAASFNIRRGPTFWFSRATKCMCSNLWLKEFRTRIVLKIGSAGTCIGSLRADRTTALRNARTVEAQSA